MPPTAARVLVVEDEPLIRTAVASALREEGYLVEAVGDGAALTRLLTGFRPDLAVLDVMLPGEDGLRLARRVRDGGDIGVLLLTARDAVEDRLAGFDAGADDYLVKPFAMAELLARVRALLRRRGGLPDVIQVGDLLLDEAAGVAVRGGEPLELTATEFRLLTLLVRYRGRTLSKTQILTQVWGYDNYDPNLVEVHVSAVRRKTEAHGPRLLHTVRGLGYVVRPPAG